MGSGNFTLSRIWDGMTHTNALSHSGVETSSKASDGWCGSPPMQSISWTAGMVPSTAIHHRNASMPKCTPRTAGVRHIEAEIPEDNDMLIDVQSPFIVGDARVCLIFMFNGTDLMNFTGYQRDRPVCITIGNLSSMIRQMPSIQSIPLVAFLLIPIKHSIILPKRLDGQLQINREVLNEVLWPVPQPLTFTQHPSAESWYYNVLNWDDNSWHCKPVSAA